MRINVKPLTHWVIYRGYKVRFSHRALDVVTGNLTTSTGEVKFRYDPTALIVYLPEQRITLNQYGWELNKEQLDSHE